MIFILKAIDRVINLYTNLKILITIEKIHKKIKDHQNNK